MLVNANENANEDEWVRVANSVKLWICKFWFYARRGGLLACRK